MRTPVFSVSFLTFERPQLRKPAGGEAKMRRHALARFPLRFGCGGRNFTWEIPWRLIWDP
jgi:hypothetical protein